MYKENLKGASGKYHKSFKEFNILYLLLFTMCFLMFYVCEKGVTLREEEIDMREIILTFPRREFSFSKRVILNKISDHLFHFMNLSCFI